VFLTFLIAGLTTGSAYALAGVGLVLTYKASGVFNFAQGALATVAAYAFYAMHTQHGVPWPVAAAVCIVVLGPLMGVMMERLARALGTASLAANVASTVGILLIVQAVFVLIYGTTQIRQVNSYLPAHVFHLAGATVTTDRIVVFVVGAVATAALYYWFRLAHSGVSTRAVVDNAELLDIAGTSPTRVRRYAWIIGSTFAATSGVLIAPFVILDPTNLTFLVVAAFGAAAIGLFRNLPLTYLGGLALGVGASFATKYLTSGLWSGLAPTLPFVALFVILLLAPKRLFTDDPAVRPSAGASQWRAPWPVHAAGAVALLVLLVLVPSFAGVHINDWTQFLADVVLFLSLGLLTRTSGQVSLCQVTLLAIGVTAFSHLAVDHHWPWGLALVMAGVIAIPIGALLAVPAIRLSGLALALATFGFGVLVQEMFYNQPYMFGDLGLGVAVPRPHVGWADLASDQGFYYFVLAITVVITIWVVAINRSRLGRLLRGLADSAVGLAAGGTSIDITRVLVFCVCAFLAAVSGVLGAAAIGQVDGDSYQPLTSLVFFALIVISVGSAPWYAIVAAAGYALIPSYFSSATVATYLQLLFGVFAVLYAVTPPSMKGVPAPIAQLVDRFLRPAGRRRTVTQIARAGSALAPAGELSVSDVRVRFGGLVAVDGVTLSAGTGSIIGLIGPNGAGKTTIFNLSSGFIRATSGRVSLNGRDVSRLGPASRARQGLGRTFQRMELFDSLTVRENVELGSEASRAGLNPVAHLFGWSGQREQVRAAAAAAMALCDLDHLADATVGTLSTGQRRLVELARCVAGPFRLLLLDEPSSGLDRAETSRFGEVLQTVVRDRGLGILLVEHDMTLVNDICHSVHVLDFGKLIFTGTPDEVMASPAVRAAYLGDSLTLTETPTATDGLSA
jgi:ABC-type branched-subunit amino acid transport system ATPase component/branched-subunit amino acid ABC-type transport system permease component